MPILPDLESRVQTKECDSSRWFFSVGCSLCPWGIDRYQVQTNSIPMGSEILKRGMSSGEQPWAAKRGMYKPFFNHSHSTHHNHHSLRNQMILRPHLSPRITARVIAHPYFLSSVSENHRLTKHPPLSSTNPTSRNETHPTHLQLCPKVAQEAARICSLKNFPTHLPAKEAWNIPDSHVVVNTKVGKQADKSKCDQHGPQIYPKLKPAPQSSLPQEPQIHPRFHLTASFCLLAPQLAPPFIRSLKWIQVDRELILNGTFQFSHAIWNSRLARCRRFK